MPLQNHFKLVSISGHAGSDGSPFSLSRRRVVCQPTDGPAAASGKRVAFIVTDFELGDSPEQFADFLEKKLRERFGNPAVLEPFGELLEAPSQWTVRLPYVESINRRTRRDKRGERATKGECQNAPGTVPSSNLIYDAGGARHGYAGLAQGDSTMKFLAAYPDGSFLASDGLLHAADGSLLRPAPRSAAQATVDFANFASSDSDGIDGVDPVTRAKNAYERARRDLSDAESAAQAKIEQMDADNMPASRREDLLAQSSLGRRCLIDADDPKYKKAVRRAKADRAAAKSLTVTSGPEKSRTYNAGKGT